MKKALKWVLIGLGAIILVAGSAIIYLSVSGKGEQMAGQYKAKAIRANGKILASIVYTELSMAKIESDNDSFPDMTTVRSRMTAMGSEQTSGPYSFGVASESEDIRALCPDCEISPKSFKIAVIGNIDDDEELDVITMDHEKKVMLVKDDLGEHSEPVDITPKGAP